MRIHHSLITVHISRVIWYTFFIYLKTYRVIKSMLEILAYPDKRLRQQAKPVTVFDESLQAFVDEMYATMYDDEGCGLAATQVGSQQRLFVMDTSSEQNAPICMINPEIIHQEEIILSEEGCLSFPGIRIEIERFKIVTVKFQDVAGKFHELTVDGLASRCVQHELDHLNGVLFIDWLSKLKKTRILKKLEKNQRA